MDASEAEDPECEVSVCDHAGKRWTMIVRAGSMYRAVFAYDCEQIAGRHRDKGFPKLTPESEIEVRAPDGRVLRTTFARAMAWGNAKAEGRLRNPASREAPARWAFTGRSRYHHF